MSIRAHPVRFVLAVVGAALLIAGLSAIVIAVRAQQSAPQPPLSAASPVLVIPRSSGTPTLHRNRATRSPGPPRVRGQVLSQSAPTHLSVPAIGVDTSLKRIGLNSRHEIAIPPLDRDSHAYWLTVSPTPGQLGPAVIIGHVDSAAYGPAVFFRLGALRQRDRIAVTRADGIVAEFEVERVVEYPKDTFPTRAVYGNLDHAGLRLITCGGTFNAAQGSYESNIVVYASLVSTHRA